LKSYWNSSVMSVKTNKPIHSKTKISEISFKDHLQLITVSDYLKPVKDLKPIMIKKFFSLKSTKNKDNKKQKENKNLEDWKRNVSMIRWKEDTCKLIAPSLMISSLELKLQAGRTLELIFAPKIKDDAD
jgi:viroplasmin and RNaseH domain-containing protein